VATNPTRDVAQLARQMARVDERGAASQFYHQGRDEPVRPLSAREIAARFSQSAAQDAQRQRPSDAGGQAAGYSPERIAEARARAAAARAGGDAGRTQDRDQEADRSR